MSVIKNTLTVIAVISIMAGIMLGAVAIKFHSLPECQSGDMLTTSGYVHQWYTSIHGTQWGAQYRTTRGLGGKTLEKGFCQINH